MLFASPFPRRVLPSACALATLACTALLTLAHAAPGPGAAAPLLRDGQAEQRLLQVLALTSAGLTAQALPLAEALVHDYPNFQLAQLALGDLLLARTGAVQALGNTEAPTDAARATLQELRQESLQRVTAQKLGHVRPGTVPVQVLALPSSTRHVIAVDAALSRLYLLENTALGLRLVGDYYASVGKLGIDKVVEGDQRTPLGVYFITSRLDPKTLKDFYGAGALPLNYPNALDMRRGKTGHGIWLHGTPPNQFSRAPLATDGCVALANPDLERLLQQVEPRTTPVIIAPQLQWAAPADLASQREAFSATLAAWQQAKTSGDMAALLRFYADDFQGAKQATLASYRQELTKELAQHRGGQLALKELSILHWQDSEQTMVVTFGQVLRGQRSGTTKRQYWRYQQERGWQIFFEGRV